MAATLRKKLMLEMVPARKWNSHPAKRTVEACVSLIQGYEAEPVCQWDQRWT